MNTYTPTPYQVYLAQGHLGPITPWGQDIITHYMKEEHHYNIVPVGEWITANQTYVVVQPARPSSTNKILEYRHIYHLLMPCRTIKQSYTDQGIVQTDTPTVACVVYIFINYRGDDLDPVDTITRAIHAMRHPISMDTDTFDRICAIYRKAGAAGRLHIRRHIQQHYGHYAIHEIHRGTQEQPTCYTARLLDIQAWIHQHNLDKPIRNAPEQTQHQAMEDIRTIQNHLDRLGTPIST